MQQGLLMKGSRLVIPISMRLDILDRLHEGHQGITRCREKAKTSVWWPGLSKQLEELVRRCSVCARERPNPVEPAISSDLPSLPRQKLAVDLFQLKGHPYLLVVDYFSPYPEVARLTKSNTTAADIIHHLKPMFARHGIPERFISYNGPQFIAADFARFADEYGFTHITTSPRYPQANGEIERTVQTVKNMLKKTRELQRALLAYRSTPLEHGFSPAELLMGRKIRSMVPTSPSQLVPLWPYLDQFREADEHLKARPKRNFDTRHGARDLPELRPGDQVWLPDYKTQGTVLEKSSTPRSYMVQTPSGELRRRNRRHLNFIPEGQPSSPDPPNTKSLPTTPITGINHTQTDEPTVPKTNTEPTSRTTRSGREIKIPERFKD